MLLSASKLFFSSCSRRSRNRLLPGAAGGPQGGCWVGPPPWRLGKVTTQTWGGDRCVWGFLPRFISAGRHPRVFNTQRGTCFYSGPSLFRVHSEEGSEMRSAPSHAPGAPVRRQRPLVLLPAPLVPHHPHKQLLLQHGASGLHAGLSPAARLVRGPCPVWTPLGVSQRAVA